MSSCQEDSKKVSEAEVVEAREAMINEKAMAFLRSVAHNMCVPEGVGGHIDQAFHINRRKIIGEIFIKVGKELLDV